MKTIIGVCVAIAAAFAFGELKLGTAPECDKCHVRMERVQEFDHAYKCPKCRRIIGP